MTNPTGISLPSTTTLTARFRWAPLAAVLAALALAALSGGYAWLAYQTLQRPYNRGQDMQWAYGWLAFAALVTLSHALPRPQIVTLIWIVLLAGMGITMSVISGQLLAVIITVWLMVLCGVWGVWVCRRLGLSLSLSMGHTTITLSLGLALLTLVGFTLGVIGLLSSQAIWVACLVLTLVQAPLVWRWRRSLATARDAVLGAATANRETGILCILMGFVFLRNLLWSLSPEVMYDALNYHLPVGRDYLAAGRLIDLPHYWQSYYAHLVDMLYTVGLALHSQIVAKLLSHATGVIATCGVFALGRRWFSPRVGWWAAALFVSTPLVSWLCTTTYIDLTIGMFVIGGVLAWLEWREDPSPGWIWVAATLLGAAIAGKITAGYSAPILTLAVLWSLLRTSQPWRSRAKVVSGALIGVVLIAVPWFAMTYAFTTNPLYPLFSTLLGAPAGEEVAPIFRAETGIILPPVVLWLNIPFEMTFLSNKFGEALPNGGLGVTLLLLPLALLRPTRPRRMTLWLIGFCLVGFVLWALGVRSGRYYIPLMPVFVVLGVAAVVHLSTVRPLAWFNGLVLGVALISQAAITPLQYFHIPERYPYRLVFGQETTDAFLQRALAPYRTVQHLNSIIKPGERVVGAGVESIRYYLNGTLHDFFASRELVRWLDRGPRDQFTTRLLQNDIQYVIVNRNDRVVRQRWFPFTPSFTDAYMSRIFSFINVDLYRLQDVVRPSNLTVNFLENASFEALDEEGIPELWTPYGKPGIIQEAGKAHEGRISIGANRSSGLFQPVTVVGGQRYLLGHYARADKPNQSARLQINWHDGNGQRLDVTIDVKQVTTDWIWRQVEVTAPVKASKALIYVSVHEDGQIIYDDFWFGPAPAR